MTSTLLSRNKGLPRMKGEKKMAFSLHEIFKTNNNKKSSPSRAFLLQYSLYFSFSDKGINDGKDVIAVGFFKLGHL